MRAWPRYSLAQQQGLFDTAVTVASQGVWDALEEQLQMELDDLLGGGA